MAGVWRPSAELRRAMMALHVNIVANRRAAKYSWREQLSRLAWGAAYPLFRFSPRPCFGWRRWLLRRFGARVGRHAHIYNTVQIQYPWLLEVGDFAAVGDGARIYNLGPVTIGARATVSQFAHLCAGTHDYTDPAMPLEKLPISVEDDAWICAEAFVGPNVTVGQGAVVGARAAVFSDVEPWSVVGGNPARFIKRRELKHVANAEATSRYCQSDTI